MDAARRLPCALLSLEEQVAALDATLDAMARSPERHGLAPALIRSRRAEVDDLRGEAADAMRLYEQGAGEAGACGLDVGDAAPPLTLTHGELAEGASREGIGGGHVGGWRTLWIWGPKVEGRCNKAAMAVRLLKQGVDDAGGCEPDDGDAAPVVRAEGAALVRGEAREEGGW